MSRWGRLGLAVTASLLGGLGLARGEPPVAAVGAELKVLASHGLPLPELSGLARVPGAGLDLRAIGDARHALARFRLDETGGEPLIEVTDLGPRLGVSKGQASQWEAIASDGLGNLYILGETSGELVGLDPDLNPRARFPLDVSSDAELKALWDAEPNSRGEGLLLLRDGHVLLLKEKKPALLIEFGPPGATPRGYDPNRFLGPGEGFRLPPGNLVALKSWAFAKGLKALAKDASELALGPDGRLYLLSQDSGTLVRLEASLAPEENKVRETAHWRLPRELDKAEGLVLDDTLHPWVAIDSKGKRDRPNLFRLSPLGPDQGH